MKSDDEMVAEVKEALDMPKFVTHIETNAVNGGFAIRGECARCSRVIKPVVIIDEIDMISANCPQCDIKDVNTTIWKRGK